MPRHRELTLQSRLSELSQLGRELRQFCAECSGLALDEQGVWELELAVNEAMSNVVKHAYRGREGETLRVRFEEWPDRVVVRLFDRGSAFDPSAVRQPRLDGTEESGLGLFLIARLVDEHRHDRSSGGENALTLVKRRRAGETRSG